MNIGFDLDKVFINTPPFIPKKVIDRLYKKRDNGTLLYRIPGPWEQKFRSLTHISMLRPPITENLQFLKSFSKEQANLYLISSRFQFLEKQTQKLVEKYGLEKIFDQMHFNSANEQPHLFKDRIIKLLKLDYYIDDDLSLLRYVAEHNPKTKFYWLTEQTKHIHLPKNISAIAKLPDVFKL